MDGPFAGGDRGAPDTQSTEATTAKSTARSRWESSFNGDSTHATIVVENPASRASGHVERLKQAIEWIRGFANPRDAYRARLREIADADPGQSRQLGLVRVAYEGGGILSCNFDGSVVVVTVELDL